MGEWHRFGKGGGGGGNKDMNWGRYVMIIIDDLCGVGGRGIEVMT